MRSIIIHMNHSFDQWVLSDAVIWKVTEVTILAENILFFVWFSDQFC